VASQGWRPCPPSGGQPCPSPSALFRFRVPRRSICCSAAFRRYFVYLGGRSPPVFLPLWRFVGGVASARLFAASFPPRSKTISFLQISLILTTKSGFLMCVFSRFWLKNTKKNSVLKLSAVAV
jgi:hypothetical protein